MNTLSTLQRLSKLGKVLSGIALTFSMIGLCGCTAGLLSLCFGTGGVMKLGGVAFHGLISAEGGYNIKSMTALLWGWLVACAGEGVLAGFAKGYFKNELNAGTPFTVAGARELLRLGILTIAIPAACAVAGGIAWLVSAGFRGAPGISALHIGNGASIALGVMFILGSLLCRYGAERER